MSANLETYLAGFDPMKAGRLRQSLGRLHRVNGEVAPRHAHAERLAGLPTLRFDPDKGRLYTADDGRFLAVADLTQSLVDYVLYLRGSR